MFNLEPIAPLFRSIAGNDLSRALYLSEADALRKLQKARRECLDYYKDEVLLQYGGSDEYLKNFFRTFDQEHRKWDEPAKLDLLLTHLPMTRQLVDLKGRIYGIQPERKVGKDRPEKAEKYTDLLKRSGWFPFSKVAERYAQLLNDVAVGVFVKDKLLQFVIIPEYYPVFSEDDEFQVEPAGIMYPTALRGKDGSQIWAYWDAEVNRKVDALGNVIEEKPNEYRTFNFFFPRRSYPVDSHTSMPRTELVLQNREIDMAVSALNQLLHYNGFKQLVVVGDTDDSVKEFKLGNKHVLKIKPTEGVGAGALQAYPLDMQANFSEHIEAIKFQMELASNTMNLNFNWSIDTGNVSSGRALQIKNVRDLEDRTAQIEIIDAFIEQPLYRIVSEMSGRFGLPAIEKGDLIADFPEQESGFSSVSDEIAWRQFQLETGVISKIDLIMEENPDLTEEEAVKKLDDNTKINGLGKTDEDTILAILRDEDGESGNPDEEEPGGAAEGSGQNQGTVRDLAPEGA